MSARRGSPLATGLACLVAGAAVAGCTEVESATVDGYHPSKVTEDGGATVVSFTDEGMRRSDLRTAAVGESGGQAVVPYQALLYDADGKPFVYTVVRPQAFERAAVVIERFRGDRVVLAKGPAPGTAVVTQGAALVHGTENDISGSH